MPQKVLAFQTLLVAIPGCTQLIPPDAGPNSSHLRPPTVQGEKTNTVCGTSVGKPGENERDQWKGLKIAALPLPSLLETKTNVKRWSPANR